MELQYEKDNKDRVPYEHYLKLYQEADPCEISRRTGISYEAERRIFTIRLLGVTYEVTHPDFQASHQPEERIGYYPLETEANARIFVLRYLVEGHAVLTTGKFLTYREAPWGTVYLRQFTGRCVMRLAYGFGNKQRQFSEALEKIGAVRLSHGDISYEFEVLEGYRLQMILWEGDDEFPPSAQILFSDNFPVAFHPEDLVVACDISISMIKALAGK